MQNDIYLDHFIEAHKAQFNDALIEIEAGKKQTHWIWFIFPIAKGLAKSDIAQYYEINSLDEARAFIEHDLLGSNYRKSIKSMLNHSNKSALDILGKRDKWKFQASITLFHYVTDDQALKGDLDSCLRQFYDGYQCKSTSRYLAEYKN